MQLSHKETLCEGIVGLSVGTVAQVSSLVPSWNWTLQSVLIIDAEKKITSCLQIQMNPYQRPPPQRTFLDTPERARSVHALVTFNYSSIWAKSQWYKRLHISVSQTWLLTSIIKEACLQNTFPGLTPEMLIQVRPLAPLLPEYKAHYKQALYETNIHRTMLSFSCDNHIPVMVQGTELDSHLIHRTPRSSPCPVQAPTVQWIKNHPFVWTLHLLSLVSPPPPLPEFPSAFLLGFL